MKFGFIGAGKVGFSLGKYFADHDLDVVGYYSEIAKDAAEAATFTGSKAYDSIEAILTDSDVLFITVPDDAIGNVWDTIKTCHFSNKIVCHTSGALSSKIFSDIAEFGSYGYSIHPLFAISDPLNSYKELSKTLFTIEGSPEKLDVMSDLFVRLGNKVAVIEPEDKVKYHAACAMASNLVVGLVSASEKLLEECGIEDPHMALSPILESNMKHIVEDGAVGALTGPIERGDVSTVEKHISVLDGERKEMYLALSKEVLRVAKEKNPDRDYSEMEKLLVR
ncbi:MAG: DUF2520 domain-containing protein [Eubacterium sp.]|nr:DUF2520 domain-containing protein [Eubacterium sp.]